MRFVRRAVRGRRVLRSRPRPAPDKRSRSWACPESRDPSPGAAQSSMKTPDRRTAFMQLSGRVQKRDPNRGRCTCNARRNVSRMACSARTFCAILLDEGIEREVIARPDCARMPAKAASRPSPAAERRANRTAERGTPRRSHAPGAFGKIALRFNASSSRRACSLERARPVDRMRRSPGSSRRSPSRFPRTRTAGRYRSASCIVKRSTGCPAPSSAARRFSASFGAKPCPCRRSAVLAVVCGFAEVSPSTGTMPCRASRCSRRAVVRPTGRARRPRMGDERQLIASGFG